MFSYWQLRTGAQARGKKVNWGEPRGLIPTHCDRSAALHEWDWLRASRACSRCGHPAARHRLASLWCPDARRSREPLVQDTKDHLQVDQHRQVSSCPERVGYSHATSTVFKLPSAVGYACAQSQHSASLGLRSCRAIASLWTVAYPLTSFGPPDEPCIRSATIPS